MADFSRRSPAPDTIRPNQATYATRRPLSLAWEQPLAVALSPPSGPMRARVLRPEAVIMGPMTDRIASWAGRLFFCLRRRERRTSMTLPTPPVPVRSLSSRVPTRVLPSSRPAPEYWYRHGSCSRARMPDQVPVIREHDVQTDLHGAEQSCMKVIGVYMRYWQIQSRSPRDHLLALDQLVSTSFHAGGITPALAFCAGMFWNW